MKYLMIIIMLFMANVSLANEIETYGLTPVQQAELALKAKQLAELNKKEPESIVPDVGEAEKWINLGSNLGKGLAATARELGQEVNTFASTGVGLLATVIIVWNYVGDDIVLLTFAFFLVFIALPVWLAMYIKYGRHGNERVRREYGDGGKLVATETTYDRVSEDKAALYNLFNSNNFITSYYYG